MQLHRTRVTPEARLVTAAAVVALVALLLAQAWRDLLDAPAQPPSPVLNAPTLPARTAAAPLLTTPPGVTTAPQVTAAPTVAPAVAPPSITPSAPPTISSPPQVGPGDAGSPNFLAPADGDPPAVPAKVSPPPKG